MIKRIFVFLAVVAVVFLTTYFLHNYVLNTKDIQLSFPLLSMYLFNVTACVLIYIIVELVVVPLPNETGYLYLALMMIKLGVFLLLFQGFIFSESGLSKPEKLAILLPLLTFLLIEAGFVSKLLNNK
ncbi:DUF6168 family protein [Tenacibaculum sp. 190524A02b]|uniref:Uncharacterized protein n=1 Tax=Tenacibaculum vairaonense TaxID=3137860 RepID=A0ABM9PQ99_9FLAO